jgi:hypothetical protein
MLDPSDPINRGLVARWVMNEGAGTRVGDLSGNGRTGAITGAAWVTRETGPVLKFTASASSHVIDYGYVPVVSQLTWCAWVRPASANSYGGILSKGAKGSTGASLYANSSRFSFRYRESPVASVHADNTFTFCTWYFVTAVYDGSNAYLYVNGVKQTATGADAYVDAGSTKLMSGCFYTSTPEYFFDGDMGMAIAYSRALTPSEIRRLYEDPWAGIIQDTPEYYIAAAGDPPASSPLPVLRYYYEQMAGFTPAAIPILVVISMAYLMRRSDVCDE